MLTLSSRGAGTTHTVQATRFVLRNLEAGVSSERVRDGLEEHLGCSEAKADSIWIGAVTAYDALFFADSPRQMATVVAIEGVPGRMARLIVRGVLKELDRIVALAVPLALGPGREQMVPRLQHRLGLSLRSARAFTALVIKVTDRVMLELGPQAHVFPAFDDLVEQLWEEGRPRLTTARITHAVFNYFQPVRAAG